jgi:hypothetical protein
MTKVEFLKNAQYYNLRLCYPAPTPLPVTNCRYIIFNNSILFLQVIVVYLWQLMVYLPLRW